MNSLMRAIVFISATFAVTSHSISQTINSQTIQNPKPTIDQVCLLIEVTAEQYNLPPSYLARLIWKESRFDHLALSPAGAQGIAQFMPATAATRGLENPFDYRQAIPASADFIAELQKQFGNLGLASAAYNAGPGRVSAWLKGKRFLPLETEDYVFSITGEPAENFSVRSHQITNQELQKDISFVEGCKKLPVIKSRTTPMAQIKLKPWGIQIAGNFKRSVANSSLRRLRARIPAMKSYQAYIQRRKTPMGKRSIYAVRIGANSKSEADNICIKLRNAGGACIVTKN